jgi:two-component sensor histidine kinase
MEQLSGVLAQDILGKGEYEYGVWAYGSKRPILIDLILHPDENFIRTHYIQIQREGKSLRAETELMRADGRRIALSLVGAPLFNGKGEIVGAIESMRDITEYKKAEGQLKHFNEDLERRIKERTESLHQMTGQLQVEVLEHETTEKQLRESLDEKVILLREIHHRVKNNLQILISLINLQSRNIQDENVQVALKETQNRVRAMSLVHEKLYQSDSLTHIDFSDYIRYLVTQLYGYYGVDSQRVTLKLDIKKIMVNINTAIPIGLMINELASNSLKHAFPDRREGEIFIAIKQETPMLSIIYTDNGVGIPADFDWRNAKSLGLRLIVSLVEQLFGTIDLDRTQGTKFTIVVKEKE